MFIFAVDETDVVNNEDQHKAKVVLVVEPSESDNMSTCVKGDSSVAGDTDEVKDNNVADKKVQETSTDVGLVSAKTC